MNAQIKTLGAIWTDPFISMTKDDKILLLHFVTRTGVYIYPVDINNIQSFITGYEAGRKNKCHFYESSKDLLSTKYKIKYLSDGLLGQIQRLSEKQSTSNIVTFKKIAIEIITLDGLEVEVGKVLKSQIIDLVSKIEKTGHPWYNETWKDGWLSLVSVNNQWFRQLWNKKEWTIIKSLDKEVLAGNIFKNHQDKIPSDNLLYLRDKFEQINCT